MTDFDPEKLKHKPNEKHTLDEVLKSLQDLIRNDLLKSEGARAPEAASWPAATPTEDAPSAARPDDSLPPVSTDDPALPAADMPLGAVVQSLEELVAKDLALTDDSMDGGGTTPGMGGVERRLEQAPRATHRAVADEPGRMPAAMPDPEPSVAPPPAPVVAPAPKAPATGQQAFSFDDDTAAPAPAEPALLPESPAASGPAPTPPVTASDFDELTVDLAPPPDDPVIGNGDAASDDLPVLTDAVSDTTAPPADDLPVLEEIALGSPGNDPAAIAARVIARLNADRRARGEVELDDATLEALRALLRDEIERHQSER